MAKLAVVYWSGTGNTEAMANLIAEGAKEAGAEVFVMQAAAFTKEDAAGYDALAFGCPAMGVEELEDAEFAPMFERVLPALPGKRVALFGSYGWGDGEWMRTWQGNVQSAGVALSAEGLIVNEAPDVDAEARCRALGKLLAG